MILLKTIRILIESPYRNENGTWNLPDNKTLLMDEGTADEVEYDILYISDSGLELKFGMEGEFLGIPFSGNIKWIFNAK
jgi:hypothetical protein